ncbi:hypothetical protein [Planomonospora venezuelensis]|uniref:Uncharacterized protein n=1 Tax=Planomonospora venezuelensis TaxID=1999 RepID=A0A841DB45_PLAVE|nr:hypothetical protein [Planomonospora venezuelensis]MBB5966053.1 hypothetical protein [Planomonospora venezuelensis]GIN03634.1 hypothetical protein Pve01_52920 [Planomonospora venezuelensis]
MAQEKSARRLAEELATDASDDPRFKDRTPGVRATRQGSVEQADADIAGRAGVGGIGTTGGGGPGGTAGQPPTGRVPDDELADTTFGLGPEPVGESSGEGEEEPDGR